MSRLSGLMSLVVLFAGMTLFQPFLTQTANANGIKASCSSQIAEAFGKRVLNDFKTTTGIEVGVHIFSSNVCLERLKNGFSNLAASTVRLTNEDKELGLIEIPVCKDPLVVITGSDCPIDNLTMKQMKMVFSGYIKNWKELGGKDLPITVIVPGESTGAYQNFKKLAMGPSEIKYDLLAAKSFSAINAVKQIPGSISFIAHGVSGKFNEIKPLKLDDKQPVDKTYPLMQTFSFVTKGEPTGAVKEAINYSISDRAKKYMKSRNMIPLIE